MKERWFAYFVAMGLAFFGWYFWSEFSTGRTATISDQDSRLLAILVGSSMGVALGAAWPTSRWSWGIFVAVSFLLLEALSRVVPGDSGGVPAVQVVVAGVAIAASASVASYIGSLLQKLVSYGR